MLGLARTALAIFTIWLLGAILLAALNLRRRRWPLEYAQPALDFAAGCGLLAAIFTLISPLGWRISPALVLVVGFVLAIRAGFNMLRERWTDRHEVEEVPPSAGWMPWVSGLLILFFVVLALGVAANTYATSMFWDGRYIWAFKGKALFSDGGLDSETFTSLARYRYTHLDYPLALPSAQAWVYRILGHVDERRAKLIGLVFWLGTAVLLACYLRRRMALPWALGVSLLASHIPVLVYHAGGGGADVQQAFCFLAAGVLLADWVERSRPEDALLAALVFGIGTLVKAEGVSMALGGALAFALAWSFRRQRINKRTALLAPACLLLPYLPWAALRASWGIPSLQLTRMQLRTWPELCSRLDAICRALLESFRAWHTWELTWPFVALGLFAYLVSAWRHRALAPLWGLLFWQLAVYLAIYAFSPYDITWHLTTSLDRVLLHLAPLGVAAAASSLAAFGLPAGPEPAPAESHPRRDDQGL
jgi:hypothetical protein